MKIVIGNSANRFYKVDGWTKELVAKMLVSNNLNKVIFRPDNHGEQYDYYAVYDLHEAFLMSEINKHSFESNFGADFAENNLTINK